jgi:phosphatidylglycerophosphatase A
MVEFATKMATLFGLGNVGCMPGTLGSLAGLLFHVVVVQNLRTLPALCAMAVSIAVAVVVCDIAEREIGENDPPCVILDEFVAMPLCFIGARHFAAGGTLSPVALLGGFLLFRFFDIVKPLGIKSVQKLSGGIGIVLDDLVAAIYTNIILSIICLTVR